MNKFKNLYTDVVIVGSGISGLYAALNFPSNTNIILITKNKLEESNSYLAQGGISVAKTISDIPLYIKDTIKAGKYENDITAVSTLVNESRENIDKLISLGVNFDNLNGELLYTKEAAHSTNRILHVKDETGKYIMEILCAEARKRNNITIYEHTYCADIIKKDNSCIGIVALGPNIQYNIFSKISILATGGIGGLFKNSTNKRHITADGICIANKNNIETENLDYIQFHPTALYLKEFNHRSLLISESLRGEGGILINAKGERFVDELLPRDVVTHAIYNELSKSNSSHVYLSLKNLDKEYIRNRFPFIFSECLKHGIDITRDPIPVCPAQHYFMGGIKVDINSRTSLKNLYAVGECSCTGVHGANRLASNSLLEGIVFAKRAVIDILNEISNITINYNLSISTNLSKEKFESEYLKMAINLFKGRNGDKDYELVNY